MAQEIDLPAHVGPCEFSTLGKLIAVRCPKELAHILQRGRRRSLGRGGGWCNGCRIGPVIRARERATDPLFRHVGLILE
jgi:hypothetical protein